VGALAQVFELAAEIFNGEAGWHVPSLGERRMGEFLGSVNICQEMSTFKRVFLIK
jgi:hypothetical protein